MPTTTDAATPTFPRLHRPAEADHADLEALWAVCPPRRLMPIRGGEAPVEDPTRPGWWPERWDGLA